VTTASTKYSNIKNICTEHICELHMTVPINGNYFHQQYHLISLSYTASVVCEVGLKYANINIYIKKTNLMQSSSMFIGNCKIALYVSVAFCVHLQEH